MKKRLGLCLLLASSLLVTSCAISEPEEKKTIITYSLWGDQRCEDYTKKTIETFEAMYPDIQVKYIMNSNPNAVIKADVIQGKMESLRGTMNDCLDMVDLKEYEDYIDLSPYLDLELYLLDGEKVAGLPISWDTNVMLFNENLYAKYYLDVPRTWEEMFNAANKMSADGVYPLYGDKNRISALLIGRFENMTGKSAFDADGNSKLTEEDEKEIQEFYQLLLDKKVIAPQDYDYLNGLENGTVAGVITSSVSHKTEKVKITRAGGKGTVSPLIVEKREEAMSGTLEPYGFYCIPSDSRNKEAAVLFLDYLVNSKENALLQACDKGIPANDKAEFYLVSNSMIDMDIYPINMMLDYYMGGVLIDNIGELGEYVDGSR